MSILIEEQDRLTELIDICSEFEYGNPYRTKEQHAQWISKAKYNLEEVTIAIDAINKWRNK